jgi:hypothetical protein
MTVTTTRMSMEVRIEDWVRTVFERSRWIVDDQHWEETEHGPRLVTWGMRLGVTKGTVAFADGGRIFMVHCLGMRRKAVEETLAEAAMSIRLTRPGGPGRLEARRDVGCGEHRFQLPFAWEVRKAGATTLVADLIDPRGDPPPATLRIRFGGDPNQPAEARRKDTLRRLWDAKWRPAREIVDPEQLWYGCPEGFEVRELRARTPHGDVADLQIMHGVHADVPVELLVAGTKDRPRCWMRAIRALEVAAESLASG